MHFSCQIFNDSCTDMYLQRHDIHEHFMKYCRHIRYFNVVLSILYIVFCLGIGHLFFIQIE